MKDDQKTISVYLIAKIAQEHHEKNERVCGMLDERFSMFIPHKHNPHNMEHVKFEPDVAATDYEAIENSDTGLIIEPFGADCSCEIGYFAGIGKPVILYLENDGEWRRTWMAKYKIPFVAAASEEMMALAQSDAILCTKSIRLARNAEELSSFVRHAVEEWKRRDQHGY